MGFEMGSQTPLSCVISITAKWNLCRGEKKHTNTKNKKHFAKLLRIRIKAAYSPAMSGVNGRGNSCFFLIGNSKESIANGLHFKAGLSMQTEERKEYFDKYSDS